MSAALEWKGVKKIYTTGWKPFQKKCTALHGLTLEVPRGSAFGLLGPNGAGKTTAVKIALGFIRPTAGVVRVLGGDIRSVSVRRKIGYLPELPLFPKTLTGKEILDFYAAIFEIPPKERCKRIDEALFRVKLSAAGNRRVGEYSKGMQQRLGIAQALLGDPQLLILDEPMSGLDPVGAKEMRDVLVELKQAGTTLFLNTHILSEVEKICDRVGVLWQGRLVREEEVSKAIQMTPPAKLGAAPVSPLEAFFLDAVGWGKEESG